MLKLQNITKIFNEGCKNEKRALDNVSIEIKDGEMLAIMGKSGSGKTTLLNIIGLLDVSSGGEYFMDEKNVTEYSSADLARLRNREIGIITQTPFLIEELNSLENVMVPMRIYRENKKNALERAAKLLCDMGLKEQLTQRVSTLSGGERQRVAIARALANNPKYIIADEPTGSLDSNSASIIMSILTEINAEGRTVVVVTHDSEIAKQCEKNYFLADGQIESVSENQV